MLFEKDATYYADQVKKKEMTVKTLVEAALQNIEDLNTRLNAVTHIQTEEALKKAEKYDRRLSSLSEEEVEALPPFFWSAHFTERLRTRRSRSTRYEWG